MILDIVYINVYSITHGKEQYGTATSTHRKARAGRSEAVSGLGPCRGLAQGKTVYRASGEAEEVMSDEELQAVLMVGYGYHRAWDPLYQRSRWVKGWLPGAPTNPLNDKSEQFDSDEE